MTPVFLELAELIRIHRDQMERYGGAMGVRDLDLLKSAIAMPAAGAGEVFSREDIFAMAAAYLFHIVRNHPFVDGNKRVGAVAAFIFLSLNGIELDAPETDFEALVMDVASSRAGKLEVTLFLRRYGRAEQPPPA